VASAPAVAVVASLGLILVGTGSAGAETKRFQGRIAFAAALGSTAGDLYTVSAHGSHRRQLTRTAAMEQAPDWSPDGRSIVYVNASEGRGGALYRVAANGTRTRRLFSEAANQIMQDPTWSPDGRRIAFTSARSGGLEIWTYSIDGKLEQITHDGFAAHPTWSPNGKELAYSARGGIFVSAADGSRKRYVAGTATLAESPVWSPNGRWIALRSLNENWQEKEVDSLVIVNRTGTVRKTLVAGGVIFPADWSPRSDAVLFSWRKTPTSDQRQLWIVRVSGGKARPVVGTESVIGSASWHR
jgi:Tol biopolymer transport system component